MRPTVVLWGGLDPGGQAGLAADLQVVWQLRAHARLVLTARTAQTDGRWLDAWPVDPDELRTVVTGLAVQAPFAVKAGMLATLDTAGQLLQFCRSHGVRPVVDPLHRASSGGSMWPGQDEAEVRSFLLRELLPHAAVVTPNWPELQWLSGHVLADLAAAEHAMQALPCPVVLKGGHAPAPWQGIDHVWDGVAMQALRPDAIWRRSARGTGCRFATALAIELASGITLTEAARQAKRTVALLVDQGL